MKEVFIDIPVQEADALLNVSLAGISYCDKNYKINRPNSNVLCLEYIISGRGTVVTQNKIFYPEKGDTYLLLPHEDHLYYSDADDPWVKIWINVSGKLVESLIDIYNLRSQTVFHCNCYPYIKKFHITLTDKNNLGQTELIFHEIIQFLKLHSEKKQYNITDASILKRYIDEKLYSQIYITELAQLICKSEAQTIRIFRKNFNITPYEYHLQNKLQRAITFLESTNLTVQEIAYKLGFSDEHYFSGLFKKKTGKTPSEIRKNKMQLSQIQFT